MNALITALSTIADYSRSARIRWACLRTGHDLIAMTDGPVCTRCGQCYRWHE